MSIASGRGTANPYLAAIVTAARINRQSGGAVISPWDVWGLSETWLDAFAVLDTMLPQMREGLGRIERRKAEIRAAHKKQYRH